MALCIYSPDQGSNASTFGWFGLHAFGMGSSQRFEAFELALNS